MIKNYTPATFRTITSYSLVFDDGHGNGFWFSCDKNGTILNDNPAAIQNHKWCLQHAEKFIRFNKIVKESWTVKDPAYGTCHCGNKVHLVNEYYGACQCDQCGQWYNLSGQEILHPVNWQENLDEDY